MPKDVTIVGGGLVGSCLAVGLAQRKFNCEVLERRPDPRSGKVERGRSINLALSTRGIYALAQIGMEKSVLAKAIPMRGRMIHALDGTTQLQRYGYSDVDAINSVSRADLNLLLLEAAEKQGVTLRFDERALGLENSQLLVRHEETKAEAKLTCQYLFGADGSASALRHDLERRKICQTDESVLSHGYKELLMPAKAGAFAMEKHALHIWPRQSFMLIALPNPDQTFTCTLFLAHEGDLSFANLKDSASAEEFFEKYFPDFLKLVPDTAEQFFAHPLGRMVTLKCSHWGDEKTLLLGDAAHAIVPFFGQGMNCGFEDCTAIWAALDRKVSWKNLAHEMTRERKMNADAIADMAVENFVEMRDKVADPLFLSRKAMELWLHEKFPDTYINRYQLVTFTRVPYAVARSIGQVQDEILQMLNGQQNEALANKLVSEKLRPLVTPYLSVIPDSLKKA